MTETRRVICWRHGRTTWNAEKRFQGQTDIPLDELGVAQAERAAALLATMRPDAIIASDLRRAADTAAFLARCAGLGVEYDKGLRERFGGPWEGLTAGEIRERWAEEYTRMDIPGGEDLGAVGERVQDAVLRGLAAVPEHGLLVVVSHGAALRGGINRMLGLPPERREVLGPLGNCSWSLLGPLRSGGWRLLEHNAASLPEERPLGDDR
ncbi:histidine phosphatase family protein [Allosalinactinospora lopnorensis]|uniref:histidine phosphatase family protein n=1 Tax=Allosalinactinospora lopnorensis TaxID=1352348 RepID=UPI000623C262|nr:histidine phosphatase family protein [Allosalinactinospora lopnorensis]